MGVHGDILDSSVLKSLKFGDVDNSNHVFKLFANITPAIFWISSALVIAASYIGKPIKCISDNNIAEIAEAVCWIHGTYHVDGKISEKVYGSVCKRSYDTYGLELSDTERDADTSYYQWVPFMLFIHGAIFLISAKIWKVLENGLLEQFGTKKNISRLIEDTEISKVAKQNAKRFMSLSRNANNRYFLYFILCEMGNIAAVIFNFYLIDMFLGGRFKYYGSDVLAFSNTNDKDAENPICSAFPTLTSCDVRLGGVVKGSTDTQNILCILSQNIINGKIYLVIWFWMIILLIACAINSIYRIALLVVPGMRKHELVCLINTRRRRGEFLDKDNIVREHWQELNKIGTWFLMCQVGRNSNPYYFREFLQCLIENDKNRKSSTRSNNGLEEKNLDVEEGTLKKPLF
jgi:hypothetical protein